MIFSTSFFYRFWKGGGRVGGGFGRALGRVWRLLGASWAMFWPHFFVLAFGMLSGRALGGFYARFRLDFKGFGRGLGRVLELNFCVFYPSPRAWLWQLSLGGHCCLRAS